MPAALHLPPVPFTVAFGQPVTALPISPAPAGLQLNIPVLGGEPDEILFREAWVHRDVSGLQVCTGDRLLLGCATEAVTGEHDLAVQTQSLYQRLLAATRGRHLYRIWNYVPRINALAAGFENYRAFCQGRSLAFEREAGTGFPQVLPAASAVGTADDRLSVVFVAGAARPQHFENPEQVPAYRYPAEHGPRSPSFSRATVATGPGLNLTFISGTAAIKGHHTVAPGTLEAQLACTLDNLRLVSRAVGRDDRLGAAQDAERHFKVYLRHAEDLGATRRHLEHALLQPGDHVTYLLADICRAALNVEIEVTLIGRSDR